MVSFAPTSAETLEDRRRYLEGHLVEVACLDCLARVGVRKHSPQHTSIQWTGDSAEQCSEFARARAEGGSRPLRGCSRLRASIDQAVSDGRLALGEGVD